MGTIEKGNVFSMNTSVEYLADSVVSKEIIHNASGSVTLFSFDAGQGLSEHIAPYDALVQVVDGTMNLTVEGTEHTIKSGECFVIPSGARHSVHAAQRFKMLLTMIRG